MDLRHTLVPIALFLCLCYAFKTIVDAVLRHRLLREPGSEELLRSILEGEAAQQRLASLRWGLLLIAAALALGLIQAIGWRDVTPGAVGVLLGFVGLAHLVYYALVPQRP